MNIKKTVTMGCIVAVACVGALDSFAAKEKKRLRRALEWPTVETSSYSRVFVEDCRVTDPKAGERKIQNLVEEVPKRLADYIAYAIDEELYPEVERRAPEPGEEGLLLRVELTQYKPGSQTARWLMAGTSAARLDLEVFVIDAASGETLTTFTEDRNFNWGGMVGMRSITLMEEKAGTELAAYLSLCKGASPDAVIAKLKLPDEDDEAPEGPHGTIILMRPQGMVGAAVRFRIGVDDITVGESKRNSYHMVWVAPGPHKVWAGSDKKKRYKDVDVVAGETYYFQAMGLKQMPTQKAEKKLNDCKLVRTVDATR